MIEFNWMAGAIAFVLMYVPLMIVFVILYKRNKEIDRQYQENIKQINQRYGASDVG